MSALPSGTVTFLFTDIEGSTQLWEKYPEEMRTALAQQAWHIKTRKGSPRNGEIPPISKCTWQSSRN